MTNAIIAGKTVEIDSEGYLQKPEQWDEDLGIEIARELGLEMSERHWQVVHYMRNQVLDTGSAPSIRSLGKKSGVPIKELYQLFPRGPAKMAAKIAGIPKPHGCI